LIRRIRDGGTAVVDDSNSPLSVEDIDGTSDRLLFLLVGNSSRNRERPSTILRRLAAARIAGRTTKAANEAGLLDPVPIISQGRRRGNLDDGIVLGFYDEAAIDRTGGGPWTVDKEK
jgi:hypothetical protein